MNKLSVNVAPRTQSTAVKIVGPTFALAAIQAAILLVALSVLVPGPLLAEDAPSPLPNDRPLRVGFLVVDGVYNTELMAPFDIFHHTVFHAKPGMEVFTVSPNGKRVTTFEGIVIKPKYGFHNVPPIDILVVPSAEGSLGKDLENERMVNWVRETANKARYVVSLCDGAFVLAQAGLLDGVAATTFPSDLQAFAQRFPKVDLRINVNFVHAGKYLTSQGGVRSSAVAMYLVEKLYGEKAAKGVGRGLLIPWPPGSEAEPPFAIERSGPP